MELPNIGANCQLDECKTLDFLPITCVYCKKKFCQNHFQVETHKCEHVIKQSRVEKTSTRSSSLCSESSCSHIDVVEMLCVKCELHFCLAHRYHECFEYSEKEIADARKSLNVPREQFAESLDKVSVMIEQQIEKSKKTEKNRALALKVQLMRLKGKANGEVNIPMADRIFFLLFPPYQLQTKSKAVFVSKHWSIGRTIDSIASLCDVPNKNNVSNSSKLRLFRKSDGLPITTDLSVTIAELLEVTVKNGDALILEYVNSSDSLSKIVINNYSDYLE